MTHKSFAFNPEIGANMVRRLIANEPASDETILQHHILEHDDTQQLVVANKAELNYFYRPEALSSLPRILHDMWYYIRPLGDNAKLPDENSQKHPFRLREGHPLANTFVVSERRKTNFEIPRFFSSTPTRPTPDAEPTLKETYAAFKLGNFVSNRTVENLPGDSLWDKLLAWEGDDTRDARLTKVVERMLAHLQSYQQAAQRAHERHKNKLKCVHAASLEFPRHASML